MYKLKEHKNVDPEFEMMLFGEEELESIAEIDLLNKTETSTPRVLTYTTKDVIDNRISIPAQHSLVRLSKNLVTNTDAINILDEIKFERLGGIYCVNWKIPAQRALKFGKTWWTVIPQEEDAVLMLDPGNPLIGQPIIALRRELDPNCGLLQNEKKFMASPQRIDAALLKAWGSFKLLKEGKLAPCVPNTSSIIVSNVVPFGFCRTKELVQPVLPPGNCGVPAQQFRASKMEQEVVVCKIRPCKPASVKCIPLNLKEPRICLFAHMNGDKECDALALFSGMANRWACLSGAINLDTPPVNAAIPFKTGQDIIAILNVTGANIAPKKIKEVHIFAHMFEEGIIGDTQFFNGLYRDRIVEYRSRDLKACAENKSLEQCGKKAVCKIATPVILDELTRFSDKGKIVKKIPVKGGAATIRDIPLNSLAEDVIFVLHGCNTANTNSCFVVNKSKENFAMALCKHLSTSLKKAKVFAHPTSTRAGDNVSWVEFNAGECQSPKPVTTVTTSPRYNDLGSLCS